MQRVRKHYPWTIQVTAYLSRRRARLSNRARSRKWIFRLPAANVVRIGTSTTPLEVSPKRDLVSATVERSISRRHTSLTCDQSVQSTRSLVVSSQTRARRTHRRHAIAPGTDIEGVPRGVMVVGMRLARWQRDRRSSSALAETWPAMRSQ